jgi:DNA replication protein DnaC
LKAQLRTDLKRLKLSGLLSTLEVRLLEATANQLSPLEFLELLVADEMTARQDRAIARRVKEAGFREIKRLEDFDFSFNPTIPKTRIFDLATGHILDEKRDVLISGPPGVGKSHLVQALGYQVARMGRTVLYRSIFDAVGELMSSETFHERDKILRKYLRPDLLIIDDMGLKNLPRQSGEHLFEIIMRRFELRSTFMTTNRPLEDWGLLIGDVPTATAILDRFLSRAEIITITGRSYRLKGGSKQGEPTPPPQDKKGRSRNG